MRLRIDATNNADTQSDVIHLMRFEGDRNFYRRVKLLIMQINLNFGVGSMCFGDVSDVPLIHFKLERN